MSRRRRLVWKYSAFSLLVLVAITAWAVQVQRSQREKPSDLQTVQGITDDLGRTLPADHPRATYVDVTREAGIDFVHFSGVRQHLLPEDMGSGLGWADYDGDGDDDLYVVNFAGPLADGPPGDLAGRPNALYRNDGGRFTNVAAEAGVALEGWFMGAFWGDYDNDGDPDLFVTGWRGNRLLRNDGGHFTDVTERAGVGGGGWTTGAAWGDFDGDGWLDLYVCAYVNFHWRDIDPTRTVAQYGYSVPFTLNPATFDPLPNALYRNNRDGTFTDVAPALGVADPEGRSLVVSFADFDDDADLDIYVADDVSKNALYRNRGDATFEEWSAQSLAADYRGAMGLGVGDYDLDLDLDIFITHWIAQENALYQNSLRGVPATGELRFFDVADQVGVGATGLERVSWSTSFFDWDNDGRLDLFVVNGHTFENPADTTRLIPQKLQLFWNRHPDGFFDLSNVAGKPFAGEHVGRGGALADYDRDGDLDLAVAVNGGPTMLLRNDAPRDNASIAFDLRGKASNRDGRGTRVMVTAGGRTQLAEAGSQGPYLSTNSRLLHFGLGKAEQVDAIELRWPSGTVERHQGLAARRVWVLEEGEAAREGEAFR